MKFNNVGRPLNKIHSEVNYIRYCVTHKVFFILRQESLEAPNRVRFLIEEIIKDGK